MTGFEEIPFAHELPTYHGHKLQFSFSCCLVKKDAEKAEHETQTPNSTHQLSCSHPKGSFQLFCTPRSLAGHGDTVGMWLRGEESIVLSEVQKWAESLPPPPFFPFLG